MSGTHWSLDEDNIVVRNYNKITLSSIAEMLPLRTRSGVMWRIKKLGLKSLFESGKHPFSHPIKYKTDEERIAGERIVQRRHSKKRSKDPRYYMFNNARSRAQESGIVFTITMDDIVIPDKCPIFDIPLVRGKNITVIGSPSLDRKDPKGGYTKDNIWVISHKANRLKNNGSVEDIKILASRLEILLK